MSKNGPIGPRAKRSSGPANSSHIASRGGIHKHHNRPQRVDRDGDLIMATPPVARSRGNGGRHAKRGSGRPQNTAGQTHDTSAQMDAALKLIAKAANGPRNNPKPKRKGGSYHDATEDLDEISVIGLQDSAAAKNEGGGRAQLTAWLEQKAAKGAPEGQVVKIKKVC